MPDLRLVAVSEDGTHLVLRAEDGKKYTLPIDERLRAAVRGDRARMSQIELESDSALRPRDIQARIRAGATAEEVALAAGIPVERVKRFEGPVLAERAYMAERAQKTPVRRQGESNGPLLGDLVTERLRRHGVDPETLRWDSWRRDNGCWEVLLEYELDGQRHSARWTFDPPRRLVMPGDENAHVLTGDQPPRPEPTFPFVPRLAQLPDDPLRPVPPSPPPAPPPRPATPAAPSPLDPAVRFGSPRPVPMPPEAEDGPVPGPPSVPSVPPLPPLRRPRRDGPQRRVVGPHRERLNGNTDPQAEADGVLPGRRATVPGWDEIVFGSRRKKRD
ncbi:septation protein SepH [Carbonactinospora thermoautotrophica]|uniref:septation protein SepH n=1 Tax=Carbonactinospora thermoautotrophica TaxID=1469144 RepID=UPI003DA8D89D